jgi:hypothetical protein
MSTYLLKRLTQDLEKVLDCEVQKVGCQDNSTTNLKELHKRLSEQHFQGVDPDRIVQFFADNIGINIYPPDEGLVAETYTKWFSSKLPKKERGPKPPEPTLMLYTMTQWLMLAKSKSLALTRGLLDTLVVLFDRLPSFRQISDFAMKYFYLAVSDDMETHYKFQAAYLFSTLMRDRVPDLPKYFPKFETKGYIIGGWLYRKIRFMALNLPTDEHLSLAYSIMNIKRAALALSFMKQEEALEKHKRNMLGAEYKWEKYDENLVQSLSDRTFDVARYIMKGPNNRPSWRPPSASSSNVLSKGDGGAHAYLSNNYVERKMDGWKQSEYIFVKGKRLYDFETIESDDEDTISYPVVNERNYTECLYPEQKDELITFANSLGSRVCEVRGNVDSSALYREIKEACVRDEQALTAEVHIVLEAFKVRVITASQPEPYQIGRCIQKEIHKKLRKIDCFKLTGQMVTPEIVTERLCGRTTNICNFVEKHYSKDYLGKDFIASTFTGLQQFISNWVVEHVTLRSVDYSNATDGMHPDVCQGYTNGIISVEGFLDDQEKIIFNKTMDNHILQYPELCVDPKKGSARFKIDKQNAYDPKQEELLPGQRSSDDSHVFQSHGQLMGSPSSFPGLCAANFAVLWEAINELFRRNLFKYAKQFNIEPGHFYYFLTGVEVFGSEDTETNHTQNDLVVKFEIVEEITRCLFNGDDGLFFASDELYAIWEELAPMAGLNLSVGKSYSNKFYAMINSQIFTQFNWYEDKFDENIEYHNVFTFNPGLIKGQSRVLSDTRDRELEGGEKYISIGDQLQWCLFSARGSEKERIQEIFFEHNESRLKLSCRSWNLPRCLGGLGLPFGKPPTHCQRKLAAMLMMDPDFVLPNAEKVTPYFSIKAKSLAMKIIDDLSIDRVPGQVITDYTDVSKIPVRYTVPETTNFVMSSRCFWNPEDATEKLYSRALHDALKHPWLQPISDKLISELRGGSYQYIPPGLSRPIRIGSNSSKKICVCSLNSNPHTECQCNRDITFAANHVNANVPKGSLIIANMKTVISTNDDGESVYDYFLSLQ